MQQSVAGCEEDRDLLVIEKSRNAVDYALKNWTSIGHRLADDLQHFGNRRLVRQGLVAFRCALSKLALQVDDICLLVVGHRVPTLLRASMLPSAQ